MFEPPFLGTRVAKGIPLDDIASYLNETALFRNQWGYRPEAGETDADFKERVRAELRARLDEAKAEGMLVPQVVWGYFPVNADGNDLVVYTDDERTTERMRFSFPRQRKEPYLCIADFFRPVESGDTRLRRLPDRDDGAGRIGAHGRAVRRRPLPRLRRDCTGCRSR